MLYFVQRNTTKDMIRTLKNTYHLGRAALALSLNRHPSKDLIVIGVTGTDGKTTTATLIYHILKNAGAKVALITTLGARIGDKTFDTGFHTTTPSPFALQKYIGQAKKENCKYLVLEVTSHALSQNRVFGIPFSVGVVTNITHEHLDYHKTYEKYVKAKTKLLNNSKVLILNLDDDSFKFISRFLKKSNKPLITYSIKNSLADITPKIFSFTSNLLGDFNTMNTLASIAVAKSLGLEDAVIKKAIESFEAPIGRQEVIFDKKFKVIIDFAHTPNSFAQVLSQVKKQTKGRLIHVFGAAGKRDSSKRKLMGKESSRFADVIVLAPEDPRGEDVSKINEQIAQGFDAKFSLANLENTKKELIFFSVPDRKEAIELAIDMAKEGDTVMITGKGHESSMNYGKREVPWSEHQTAHEALSKRGLS